MDISRSLLASKPLWLWYGLAGVVIALDQWTKTWAERALAGGEEIVLTGFFKFQLAYNRGAAFSFLSEAGGWQRWLLAIIALAVSGAIVVWMARTVAARAPGKNLELMGLSLILGGALGNLYDRVVLGHVVDFISWHYQHYYWPTFNIADSAVSTGAAALILDIWRGHKHSSARQAKEAR